MTTEGGRQRITRELLFATFVGAQADSDDPLVRERIIASVIERDCNPGDILFARDDEATHVHFMTEGRVRMSRPGYADWVYEGWWVMGTSDPMAGRRRVRTATVETSMRTFSFPWVHWFKVMHDKPLGLLNMIMGYTRGILRSHERLAPGGGFVTPAKRAPTFDVSTLAGRVRLLDALPLLAGVPTQLLLDLAALAKPRVLQPGESIFASGTPHHDFVVVARGELEATRTDPDVRGVFGPGTSAGGAACMRDIDSAWTATAASEATVLTIPMEVLCDNLEDHVEGCRAMMTTLALQQERLWEELAARTGELVLK